MTSKDITLLILANIVGFFGLKGYNDTRQVRLVNALLPSCVELATISDQIEVKHTKQGTFYRRAGFGRVSRGSGVIVSENGLIMTCAHVVKYTQLVEVSMTGFSMEDGTGAWKSQGKILARVVEVDEDADLALLKVINSDRVFHPVALGTDVFRGLPVLAIGFPSIFKKNVSNGVISSFDEDYPISTVVIYHGSSGGGVFNSDGELIGLTAAFYYPSEIPVFQGFSSLTKLSDMKSLLENYEGV